MAEPGRLDDSTVCKRLARIDELLERVEQVPGPTSEAAIEAVQALTDVYGEALARMLDGAGPPLAHQLAADELVGHLLVLHDIHPDPPAERVARAVEQVRPAVQQRGGDVELAGVEDGVASLRLRLRGCGSAGVEDAVRDAVLSVAPGLSVECLPVNGHDVTFVPLDTLLRPPAPARGTA